MPGYVHEGFLDLLRKVPEEAPALLTEVLEIPLARYREARVQDPDAVELRPVARRADLVINLHDGSESGPVCALIVEVQRSRDDDKLYTWPVYAFQTAARIRGPTYLLVLTDSADEEDWASRPREMVHGVAFRPLVLGPRHLPRFDTVEEATAAPHRAVLSAMAHRHDRDAAWLAWVALQASARLPDSLQGLHTDLISGMLDRRSRKELEALMTVEQRQALKGHYLRTFADLSHKQGLAEGRAEATIETRRETLLEALEVRGVEISTQERQRVLDCTDLAVLDRWFKRAIVATRAGEVFAD